MSSNILHALIYLIGVFINYYLWKRSHDKDYLWFTRLGIIAVLISTFDFFLKNLFSLPMEAKFLINIAFMIFWGTVVFLVFKILFKSTRE